MPVRLVISENAYSLLMEQGGNWTELAVFPRGAGALIPHSGSVDEASLERAIEVAVDRLMPHAPQVRGQVLEVIDKTGWLEAALLEVLAVTRGAWSIGDVEGFFLRLVDRTTGRRPSAAALNRPGQSSTHFC